VDVQGPRVFRFGLFLLDSETGELTKNGRKAALRPQAARVLAALASRCGQLVSRDELRDVLWSEGTFVDFEHGLNLCIQEIRAALHDDATSPRYVETLPRRGYRFIAPVECGPRETQQVPDVDETARQAIVAGPAVDAQVARPPAIRPRFVMAALACAAVVALIGVWARKATAEHSAPPVPRSASLAVLFLSPTLPGPDQENLAKGLTFELVKQLWRVESLRVVTNFSEKDHAKSKKPLSAIARELKVASVLSGSAERVGDRVRMRLTLVDARSGNKLWSQSYDSDLSGVLDCESDVARAVARRLDLPLTSGDEERLRPGRSVRPEAHALFLKAEGTKKIADYRALLEQSVTLDPNFSMGWSALAMSYVGEAWFSQSESPVVGYRKAKEYALRALAIDDTNSVAHCVLAAVKLHHEWDWPGAEREFRRALEEAPSNGAAHHIYAHYLLTMDRLRESVAESRKATELAPLNAGLATCVGWHCLYARQYDDAVAQCLTLINDEKAGELTYYYLGRVYARQGKLEPAIAALEVAVTKSGGLNAILATLGHVYARAGRRQDAEHVLSILAERGQKGYVAAYDVAVVYAGLGDTDKTFDWLEKAYLERSTWIIHLKWDERFADVRSDPRFESLLRRIGLPRPESVRAPERPAPVRQATILPAR
jgi:TolB-like protein/DNA-binding winged helix-turn-helix (wHTH) protein/tetratricopeptide (TPR) repeat protein